MGLFPYLFMHVFTKRFWNSVRKEGFLLTYTRGHRAVLNTHNIGGNSERTKYMGIDQFGNKYYECFDAVHPNQRRWVQFNDYFSVRSPNGDMIPAKFQGWLSGQYDDFPSIGSDSFHEPFFQKKHDWNPSNSAFKRFIPRTSIINPRAIQFHNYRVGRYAKEWKAQTKRE